jgi:4-azaleucine resistance transporter AzlC
MNQNLDVKSAMEEVLPTVFGYLGISIAFGIVGRAAGFSIPIVTLISMIVYAGSAQFVLITMLVAHSPILSIIFSVFLINSRMILMSTTVAPYLNLESMKKNILVGTFLTDESFALGMNKLNYTSNKLNFPWLNTVNIVAYWTWVIGTFMGAILGNLISNPEKFGLNFAITAMFIGLLYLQIISDKTIKMSVQLLIIFFTLLLTYLGLIFIPSNLLILITTIFGCFLGVMLKNVIH